MLITRPVRLLARSVRYVVVAVGAFLLGTSALPAAAAAIPIGSLFYISVLNGNPTTPCGSTTSALGTTTTCNAVVDSSGQVAVSDSETHKALGQLQYDSSGNLKVAAQGTQAINGTVSVSNFPATQQVAGHVSVDNLPLAMDGTLAVNPNLSRDSNGNLNVNIAAGATAAPLATKGVEISGGIGSCFDCGPTNTVDRSVHMKVTYFNGGGCSRYDFALSGGGSFSVTSAGTIAFPIPMDVTGVTIANNTPLIGCSYDINLAGY